MDWSVRALGGRPGGNQDRLCEMVSLSVVAMCRKGLLTVDYCVQKLLVSPSYDQLFSQGDGKLFQAPG